MCDACNHGAPFSSQVTNYGSGVRSAKRNTSRDVCWWQACEDASSGGRRAVGGKKEIIKREYIPESHFWKSAGYSGKKKSTPHLLGESQTGILKPSKCIS